MPKPPDAPDTVAAGFQHPSRPHRSPLVPPAKLVVNSPRVKRLNQPRTIFITGTDTGVGKTLLAALLLRYLRQAGHPALALKPFCSGGREDARLLQALQPQAITLDEINPFSFPEPLAPLVAARKHRRAIPLSAVLAHVQQISARLESLRAEQAPRLVNRKSEIVNPPRPCLLIEGVGGLLVPLGEGYTVADLLAKLNCEVLVVSPNQLGTINHTLLTVRALQGIPNQGFKVAMMGRQQGDSSARSNPGLLAEWLAPVPVISLPFLGRHPLRSEALKKNEKKLQKTLARILA